MRAPAAFIQSQLKRRGSHAAPYQLNVYMAGLMAAPMVLIELAVMRGMYKDKRLNALFAGAAVVALVVSLCSSDARLRSEIASSCGR